MRCLSLGSPELELHIAPDYGPLLNHSNSSRKAFYCKWNAEVFQEKWPWACISYTAGCIWRPLSIGPHPADWRHFWRSFIVLHFRFCFGDNILSIVRVLRDIICNLLLGGQHALRFARGLIVFQILAGRQTGGNGLVHERLRAPHGGTVVDFMWITRLFEGFKEV